MLCRLRTTDSSDSPLVRHLLELLLALSSNNAFEISMYFVISRMVANGNHVMSPRWYYVFKAIVGYYIAYLEVSSLCMVVQTKGKSPGSKIHNYRPQTKLREGNVFRSICLPTVGWRLCPMGCLCPVGSLSRGSLSRVVSVQGSLCYTDHSHYDGKAAGMHPTGMHSCLMIVVYAEKMCFV